MRNSGDSRIFCQITSSYTSPVQLVKGIPEEPDESQPVIVRTVWGEVSEMNERDVATDQSGASHTTEVRTGG